MRLTAVIKALLLALLLQGCSTNQKNINLTQSDTQDISIDNMSVALKSLYIAGFNEGFSDTELNPGSSSPEVIHTVSALGYFSGVLNPIQGPSFGLSNTAMGWMSLTQGLSDKRTASDKLDRQLLAYIPKSIAKTEADAKRLMADSMANAISQMDGLEGLKCEIVEIRYDHAPSVVFQQAMIETDRGLFYDGEEDVPQGSLEHQRPVRLFYMNQVKARTVQQTPYNDEESWLLISSVVLTPYYEMSKSDIDIEYVNLARNLPEWFFIFKVLDDVPVVLNHDKIHLFVKPTNLKLDPTPSSTGQKATHNISRSTL